MMEAPVLEDIHLVIFFLSEIPNHRHASKSKSFKMATFWLFAGRGGNVAS